MDLDILIDRFDEDSVVVVRCVGSIDGHTFEKLDDSLINLLASGERYIIVDMSRVPYVSSAGIGVLVGAHREAEKAAGGLALINLSPDVRELFRSTKLDALFTIADVKEEAIRKLSVPGWADETPERQS